TTPGRASSGRVTRPAEAEDRNRGRARRSPLRHDGAVMTIPPSPDRLRGFIDLLMESLDDPADGAEIARRAFLSRFHFDRLVGAALGEPPGAFRRRLMLERAAFELSIADAAITDVAIGAGYASLEAFERAFRRSFGMTPSAFRADPGSFRLSSPNGVHFH